jgi:hypothetical protein
MAGYKERGFSDLPMKLTLVLDGQDAYVLFLLK